MKFLGVKGDLHSRRSGRLGDRPSIAVWCNPLTRLTPGFRTNRLHTLADRQAQRALRKAGIIQSGSGCALLTSETIYRFGAFSSSTQRPEDDSRSPPPESCLGPLELDCPPVDEAREKDGSHQHEGDEGRPRWPTGFPKTAGRRCERWPGKGREQRDSDD